MTKINKRISDFCGGAGGKFWHGYTLCLKASIAIVKGLECSEKSLLFQGLFNRINKESQSYGFFLQCRDL